MKVEQTSTPAQNGSIFYFSQTHRFFKMKVENGSVLMETECLNNRYQVPSAYPVMCGIQGEVKLTIDNLTGTTKIRS